MDQVFTGLWEAAKQAGPFASIMLLTLWWFERQERLELQRSRDALHERVFSAMSEAKDAMRALRDVLRGNHHA